MYGLDPTIFGLQERIKKAFIKEEALSKILGDVKRAYPQEACGVISGLVEGDKAYILSSRPLTNIYHDERKFWFNVREWMRAIIEEFRRGRTYLGLYHSHPNGSTIPSLSDQHRMLECPEELWLIISYDGDVYGWSLWRISDFGGSIFKVRLEIIQSG